MQLKMDKMSKETLNTTVLSLYNDYGCMNKESVYFSFQMTTESSYIPKIFDAFFCKFNFSILCNIFSKYWNNFKWLFDFSPSSEVRMNEGLLLVLFHTEIHSSTYIWDWKIKVQRQLTSDYICNDTMKRIRNKQHRLNPNAIKTSLLSPLSSTIFFI